MSSLLEQAILDAKELKEAAIKNAQQALIERYSSEYESEIEKLLEQEAPAGAAMPVDQAAPVDPAAASSATPAGVPPVPGVSTAGTQPVDPEKAKNDSDNKSSIFDKLEYSFKDGEVIDDKVHTTGVVEIDLDSLSEFSFSKNKETPEQMALQELKRMAKKSKLKEGKNFPYDEDSDEDEMEDEELEDDEDFDEDSDEEEFEDDDFDDDSDEDESEDDELEDDDLEDEMEDDEDFDEDSDEDELEDEIVFDDEDEFEADEDFDDLDDDDLDDDDLEDEEDFDVEIEDEDFDEDSDEDSDDDFVDDTDEDELGDDEEEFEIDFDTEEDFDEDSDEDDEELEESENVEGGIKLSNREVLRIRNVADRIQSLISKSDGSVKSRLQSSYRELLDIIGEEEKQNKKKGKVDEAIKLDWKRTGPRTWHNGTFREEAEHDYELEQLQSQIEELEQEVETLKEVNSNLKEGLRESLEIIETYSDKNKKLDKKLDDVKKSLSESRIMNYRLLYTNKALTDNSLNERQKNRIAESVNRAKTAEEAKLLYETLQSTMREGSNKSTPKSLSEAVERRSSSLLLKGSRAEPKKQDDYAERMKRLAGLK